MLNDFPPFDALQADVHGNPKESLTFKEMVGTAVVTLTFMGIIFGFLYGTMLLITGGY